ncbi:MAG TPA: gamma-glutamyltransferase [Polyangiaceae bacterium]|nr:gamma-glutamyltransferase [Polyangiaceae bacterium]
MRRPDARMLPSVLGALVALALAFTLPTPGRAAAPAKAGAATETGLATRTALAELKRGGNAVDAIVAAALVAGVVAPSSSGLGGGGFALVHRASDRSETVLDFRETAPGSLDADAFDHRPLPDEQRGKLVGVPGEPRGLAELHRRFGKRPWAELVEPALRFARDGFAVDMHLAEELGGKNQERFRRVASLDHALWPGGKAAVLGQKVKRPELAKTLGTLAASGPESLYTGPLAAGLVSAARQFGGALSASDLTHYAVRERAPLKFAWEGYEIVTMPPPSSGGILLAELLGTYSRAELEHMGVREPLGMHLLAETMRGALADRARYVGDPDFLPIDVQRLLAPARLAARKAKVSPDHTLGARGFVEEEHGTHALVVADAQGNVVSLTTTVNTAFGAKIEGDGSGIVLNDELDDFTPRAATSAFGIAFPPNAARPGRRPASSMTPTIVLKDGKPVLALGGSGGFAIAPDVAETLLGILVQGETPEVAVKSPRFFFDPRDLSLGLGSGYPDAVRADLERRGEKVKVVDFPTAVQVLAFTPGGVVGAADPRKGGVALVE